MEPLSFIKFILAFIVVLIGLLGFAIVLKLARKRMDHHLQGEKRLYVLETTHIDAKHKCILLRRDHKEHLVLLGPNGDTVVDSYDSKKRETTLPGSSKSEKALPRLD